MILIMLRKLVTSQFEKANLSLGFLFFLLPIILQNIVPILLGLTLNTNIAIFGIVRELIYWILASTLMYLLLLAFKGKEARGKLKSVISALSVNYLVVFMFGLLTVIALWLVVPSLFTTLSSLSGTVAPEDLYTAISQMDVPSDAVLLGLFIALSILGIITFASGLYVIYKIGNLVKETGRFSNWVFILVYLALSFLLNALISLVITLLGLNPFV